MACSMTGIISWRRPWWCRMIDELRGEEGHGVGLSAVGSQRERGFGGGFRFRQVAAQHLHHGPLVRVDPSVRGVGAQAHLAVEPGVLRRERRQIALFQCDVPPRAVGEDPSRWVRELVGDLAGFGRPPDAHLEGGGSVDGVCVTPTASTSAAASPLRRATLDGFLGQPYSLLERGVVHPFRAGEGEEASAIRVIGAGDQLEGPVDHGEALTVHLADRAHEAAVVGEGGPDDEVRRPGLLGDAGRVEQRLPGRRYAALSLGVAEPDEDLGPLPSPALRGRDRAAPRPGRTSAGLRRGRAGRGRVHPRGWRSGWPSRCRWAGPRKPSGARALRSVPRAHRPGWPPAARRRRGGRGHGAPVTGRRRGCAR